MLHQNLTFQKNYNLLIFLYIYSPLSSHFPLWPLMTNTPRHQRSRTKKKDGHPQRRVLIAHHYQLKLPAWSQLPWSRKGKIRSCGSFTCCWELEKTLIPDFSLRPCWRSSKGTRSFRKIYILRSSKLIWVTVILYCNFLFEEIIKCVQYQFVPLSVESF